MSAGSVLKRDLLPGFAFKAVVIGGGYATGRELVEYFLLPAGPVGGALAILLATIVCSAACIITFLFARATRSEDYRNFFKHLLGPFWPTAEIVFMTSAVVTLAVFGAAAGALGAAVFGWPEIIGTLALVAGIIGFTVFGNESVELLFKYVSFFLYGVYALFVVLALSHFGDRVPTGFAMYEDPSGQWAFKGLQYAGYNIVGAVMILSVLRHLASTRDAVIAGALAGPLAMLPAFLFFICMVPFYPAINSQVLPSDFMLRQLGMPAFHVLFQMMIFAALLESGCAIVHAINERIANVYWSGRGGMSKFARLLAAACVLTGSIFLAARFGIVDLIGRFYGAVGIAFLLVYVVPLLTYGGYRLWKLRTASMSTVSGAGSTLEEKV